jgi:hypothetical protein
MSEFIISNQESDSSSDEFVDISPPSKRQKNTRESRCVDSRPSCSYLINIKNGSGNNVENDSDSNGEEEDTPTDARGLESPFVWKEVEFNPRNLILWVIVG